MGGFLTFIFFVIVAFYVIGQLGRIALGLWLRKKQKDFAEGKDSGFFRTYYWGTGMGRKDDAEKNKKEGEVTIKSVSCEEKKVDSSIGDYVDYEEVKDKE